MLCGVPIAKRILRFGTKKGRGSGTIDLPGGRSADKKKGKEIKADTSQEAYRRGRSGRKDA